MLEDYEPEYVEVPDLFEKYGIKFDRNHMLPITTEFVMEQILFPLEGRYRTESIMTPIKGEAPNWLIFLKMQDCTFCDQMTPYIDFLARHFHAADEEDFNYIVANIDCSAEEGIFMCQYLEISRLPKFIVFRPETENRYFLFPLAYSKSPHNLFRFAVDFWPEAYSQYEFSKPGEIENRGEWEQWWRIEFHNMLEEAAGFFLNYGFQWVPFYGILFLTSCLLFGPCLMCIQTMKMKQWMDAKKLE